MILSEDEISRLVNLGDEDVNRVLEFYHTVTENPVYNSYIARLNTLNQWNDDLTKHKVNIITLSKKDDDQGRVDKEVDRVLKFLEKQPDLVKGTEELWKKLTPQEREDIINRDKRIASGEDRAFKAKKNE